MSLVYAPTDQAKSDTLVGHVSAEKHVLQHNINRDGTGPGIMAARDRKAKMSAPEMPGRVTISLAETPHTTRTASLLKSVFLPKSFGRNCGLPLEPTFGFSFPHDDIWAASSIRRGTPAIEERQGSDISSFLR